MAATWVGAKREAREARTRVRRMPSKSRDQDQVIRLLIDASGTCPVLSPCVERGDALQLPAADPNVYNRVTRSARGCQDFQLLPAAADPNFSSLPYDCLNPQNFIAVVANLHRQDFARTAFASLTRSSLGSWRIRTLTMSNFSLCNSHSIQVVWESGLSHSMEHNDWAGCVPRLHILYSFCLMTESCNIISSKMSRLE
jgi:hypothetical protein